MTIENQVNNKHQKHLTSGVRECRHPVLTQAPNYLDPVPRPENTDAYERLTRMLLNAIEREERKKEYGDSKGI